MADPLVEAGSDDLAFAVSIAVGLAFLWRLSSSATSRASVTVLYVPIAAIGIIYYALIFVGVMFGDWL